MSAKTSAVDLTHLDESSLIRAIIDAVPDPIFCKDHECRYLFTNKANCNLFNLTESEFIGRTVFEIPGLRDHAELYHADDLAVLESGEPVVNREEPFQHADRRTGWFLTSKFPIRNSQGKIVGLVGIARDISLRRAAERAVIEEHQKLETLIEATETGFVVVDERGNVLESNAEYVRLTGHSTAEEIHGRRVIEWTALHDQERNAAAVVACAQSGQTRRLEIDYVWPNGRLLPVEINARMIDSSAGRRMIALCRDISDRRSAERQRQEMEKKLRERQKLESLGVLAGGIAHDFNNLLTTVLGGASLVAEELPPDSPVLGQVAQIEDAASRAAELCKQMLAYSGKGRFVLQRLDLSQLISQSAELLHLSIRKNADLTLDLATDLPPLLADPTQLQQIIMNLVINASEALGENGGTIRVRTGLMQADAAYLAGMHLAAELAPGSFVFIEVSDNGCGMAADVSPRIFDPFFTTKFTGRGLGLAAVLGIVRGHRGALRVETEPGWGTAIQVLLPPVEGKVEPVMIAPKPAGEWRGSGTVLVIDDEETVRSITDKMLRHMGFEVRLACDGQDGLEQFRPDPSAFVLVLLDLTMPRLDGKKTLRAIRAIRPDTRVLMMSGFTEQEVTARFDSERPDGFVEKPFRLEKLRDKVQAVLAQ